MRLFALLALCAIPAFAQYDASTLQGKQPCTATRTTNCIPAVNAAGTQVGGGGSSSLTNVTNDVQTKAAVMPNTAPSAGQIPAGNAGGTAYAPVTISGSCTMTSAGVMTCPASTTVARYFQGTTQAGVNAWPINYQTLVNGAYTATDATHLRSVLVVTANLALLGNSGTNSLGPWTVTPVVSANPSVHFIVEARATDAVNSGSMALSYACVAAGTSVDNPTPVALSAMTLATIASTKSVYESTQSVTCTGTADAPADLYVWWTPTAPSGGTLTNLRWGLVY